MPRARSSSSIGIVLAVGTLLGACSRPSSDPEPAMASKDAVPATADTADTAVSPPPAIAAWMERLTVRHHFDPETGFIVADEVVALPAVLERAPDAATLARFGAEHDRPVVIFATADRCAPCQQFKREALNDPEVVVMLEHGRILAGHLEVDREPAMARELLGGTGIPVTYLLRDGRVVDRLPGQRSAEELRAWLRAIAAG